MHEAAQGLLARHALQPLRIEIVEPQIALEGDLEHFEVESFLALKMVVDGGLIDARLRDDGPNARAVITPLGEQDDCGLHDVLARIFGRARHCIPHKFKQAFEFTLRAPAYLCNCRDRGARCAGGFAIHAYTPRPDILWSQTS